jgi:tetratricopeptide (TPR) repeat protein
MRKHLLAFSVMLSALIVASLLSSRMDAMRPPLPPDYADSDLALQGKHLKGYLLGAEGLVADWYWILSLQYLGGKIVNSTDDTVNVENLNSLNPRLLYPYLDNATDLDPKFNAAYSFGAVVLPAIDREQAIALTKKGIQNNPENWRLYQYLGYIYWRNKDYSAAAETYETGSKIPGAPPFMRLMAAAMLTRGGSRAVARAMYEQMLAEAEDEQSKRNAQLRLMELGSLEEIEAVNSVLSSIKENTGNCPASLSSAFSSLRSIRLEYGDLRIDASNNLVDPGGTPYKYDSSKCTIGLSKDSTIPKPLNN